MPFTEYAYTIRCIRRVDAHSRQVPHADHWNSYHSINVHVGNQNTGQHFWTDRDVPDRHQSLAYYVFEMGIGSDSVAIFLFAWDTLSIAIKI